MIKTKTTQKDFDFLQSNLIFNDNEVTEEDFNFLEKKINENESLLLDYLAITLGLICFGIFIYFYYDAQNTILALENLDKILIPRH